MAGYAPISLQQRCGIDGKPYPGARAYFYSADTLTPLTTFQDYGLGTPHANPVQANAFGVFPAVFLDEEAEFYRLRITTADGVTLEDLTTLPIIGPSGGGGGSEVPVDPTALRQTGDIDPQPYSGARSGYVRANARTIGSALSGASERANADCEALFLLLWGRYSDTICPVVGGRGASAAADWDAGKQLTLPDWRGRQFIAIDTMGNTSANRLSDVAFDIGDASTPGSIGGAARVTLTADQIPAHTHTATQEAHSHTWVSPKTRTLTNLQGGTNGGNTIWEQTSVTPESTSSAQPAITVDNTGGGAAHTVLDPFFTGTIYIKLALPFLTFGLAALSMLQGGAA
jgi:microcystin-dependent protein